MKLLEMFRDWEEIEEYKARTVIFSERDSADAMYVVISGDVELTLLNEPLGMESDGGMIGEMAMLVPAATRSYALGCRDLLRGRRHPDRRYGRRCWRRSSANGLRPWRCLSIVRCGRRRPRPVDGSDGDCRCLRLRGRRRAWVRPTHHRHCPPAPTPPSNGSDARIG